MVAKYKIKKKILQIFKIFEIKVIKIAILIKISKNMIV